MPLSVSVSPEKKHGEIKRFAVLYVSRHRTRLLLTRNSYYNEEKLCEKTCTSRMGRRNLQTILWWNIFRHLSRLLFLLSKNGKSTGIINNFWYLPVRYQISSVNFVRNTPIFVSNILWFHNCRLLFLFSYASANAVSIHRRWAQARGAIEVVHQSLTQQI